MTRRIALASALPLVLAACMVEDLPLDPVDEDTVAIGQDQQHIIGGNEVGSAMKYPHVARLDLFGDGGGGTCTGTLIAPTVILTAAHCIENLNGGSVRFGTGPGEFFEERSIDDWIDERGYTPTGGSAVDSRDIALLRLDEPSTVAPVPYNSDFLDQSFVGVSVTTVGFGNNVPPSGGEPGSGAGIMREVTYSIDGITAEHINVGDTTENTCQGDSGGPTFLQIGGETRVAGVTSKGRFFCQGESDLTRTDRYADFIAEVVAAWDGPCAEDGECNDSGECEFIDPDCDICGFDGFCGDDCPAPDLDCDLGGLSGDTCEDDFDCESRVCIVSPDDDRISYCSDACDPAGVVTEQCNLPLTVCRDNGGDDGTVCMYSGPTPGTQGAVCDDSDDCLGACDPNDNICVEPCSSQSDCSDEFECRSVSGSKVCALPEDGGCCSTTSAPPRAGNLALTFLTLFGLVFVARRRRRR